MDDGFVCNASMPICAVPWNLEFMDLLNEGAV